MNDPEPAVEQRRSASSALWVTQVAKEILTHRDIAVFHADFVLEDDLRFFCRSRNTAESRELANRIGALGAAPDTTLDLEGFTEDFLNTLPADITRHIPAAACVVLPDRLKSIPGWLSLHCPKVVKVRMYDGERIEICNRNLRELSVQPGRNLRHVSVFQGTALSTFGLSRIENEERERLYSETGLQPIRVRVLGQDGLARYEIPYPNRIFIECTAGSDPYEYKSNNGRAANEEGRRITCRHLADKSSKLLIEWHAGGRKSSLAQLAKNAFGNIDDLARMFQNTMDDRYFSNRAAGTNLHLTTRDGVVSFLRNQCLELAENEMRVYKIRIDRATSGHVTTQGLWSESMPDGRVLFHSVNFDANSDKPRAIAFTDPQELLKFPFFGGLHLPYFFLDDPIVMIERDDGHHPKPGNRCRTEIRKTPPSDGSDRAATFGGKFTRDDQPELFARLIEYNQSLAPVRNWLTGKDANAQCRLLEHWAAGVPCGAIESIQELGEMLVEQVRSRQLSPDDVMGILRGTESKRYMEAAFTCRPGVRSPAVSADGILATGRMLQILVSSQAITVRGAIQVLLGDDWPHGTYAGKHLEAENHLPAAAAREVLEFWCRKNLIRENEIDEILHDASADRIADARSRTRRA